MAPLLSIRDVTAGYGKLEILHGVSLDVGAGSVTTLIGANGAGKTTLMRTLAGLTPVRSGSLRFREQEITRSASHLRVENGLTLVPEGRMVFASLTVEQNLRLGGISAHARAGAGDRFESVLTRFPRLRERRGQLAGSLSGGEQQMLAIGRGLMAAPKLLLLDEPSLGLAPIMVKQVFSTIQTLRDEGYGILLAEQNARMALEIADFGYVIENGRVQISGSGAELAASAAVKKSYLGI